MKLVTLLGLALLAASARAEVLVVDAGGGAPFTSIQAAIDAAAPGDVVFVHGGLYTSGGFVIDGKPLSIIGESGEQFGASPHLVGQAVVRNLAAGTVKLDGLYWQGETAPPGPTGKPALTVADCDGSVRISDCIIQGFSNTPGMLPSAAPGLRVLRSSDVVVSGSKLTGAYGWKFQLQSPAGGAGLDAIDSRVSLWECDVHGGYGGGDYSTAGMLAGAGGPGALLQNSLLMLMATGVTGGQGGNSGPGVAFGGSGGIGLSGDDESSVWLRQSSVNGGLGGSAPFPGTFGPLGPKFVGDAESITLPATGIAYVDIPNQLVESGQNLNLLLGLGVTGGLLGVSIDGGCLPLPGWQGPLTLGPSAIYIPVSFGFMPVAVPALPPGFDELQAHLQIFGGDHTLGTPVVLTIVNDLP